jgi:hypothetical protein
MRTVTAEAPGLDGLDVGAIDERGVRHTVVSGAIRPSEEVR